MSIAPRTWVPFVVGPARGLRALRCGNKPGALGSELVCTRSGWKPKDLEATSSPACKGDRIGDLAAARGGAGDRSRGDRRLGSFRALGAGDGRRLGGGERHLLGDGAFFLRPRRSRS